MRKQLLILMNTTDVFRENTHENIRQAVIQQCLNRYLRDACSNQISDIQIESLQLGKDHKDEICHTAYNWNKTVYNAIAQGASPSVINPATQERIKISDDNQLSYQALKAFLQTGVPFYPWGERFLFNMVVLTDENNQVIDETGNLVEDVQTSLFQSVLEPSQMNHIIKFPHQYAIVNISVEIPEAAI